MDAAIWFGMGIFVGTIGLWAVSVVMMGRKPTPEPQARVVIREYGARLDAEYDRGYATGQADARAGEWATPENVAAAEEELIREEV